MKAILGKKIGMTQIFAETGEVIPVTVIEAGPEVVTQIKTVETDGYNAVQVGFEDQKAHRVNKPMTGHFEKSGVTAKKHLAEFRVEAVSYTHLRGEEQEIRKRRYRQRGSSLSVLLWGVVRTASAYLFSF